MSTNSAFLKEMGITEWISRDSASEAVQATVAVEVSSHQPVVAEPKERPAGGTWWFFGNKPQGDAEALFQNIIRVLGLTPQEWSWKNPAEKINLEELPRNGSPIVASDERQVSCQCRTAA